MFLRFDFISHYLTLDLIGKKFNKFSQVRSVLSTMVTGE